jgi:hypothetical protein
VRDVWKAACDGGLSFCIGKKSDPMKHERGSRKSSGGMLLIKHYEIQLSGCPASIAAASNTAEIFPLSIAIRK